MPTDLSTDTCARCGTHNADGAKFCEACGASLAPQILCPTCTAMNPLGRAFCTRCGGSLEHAGWGEAAAPGAVIDGEWERGGDELIRRVEPDEARKFLGTRTVRVPAGTVGVVLVDGVVDRVLAPGERTSVSLFERITSFFTGRERTAFYLVDQRPFPVPFVVRTRPSAGGEAIKTQVLVTFMLPKGDRDALARFIDNVVGPRASVSAADLYNLLRPEVVRITQAVLERQAASGAISDADAEVEIRRQLEGAIAARYGLTVDATLAPLTAVASLNLQLGTGLAPNTRACVRCRAELPASLRFCDRCGEQQPVATAGTTKLDATTPLFTVDGQQIELDLVIRAQGQHADFTPAKIAPAVVAAVAAHVREVAFAQLVGAPGLRALEAAIAPVVAQALTGLGMTLVTLAVIDARSKTGQWLLAARADLERAAEDVRIGVAWIEQRDNELDLEQLSLARVLRAQEQRRDQQFATDAATTGDRERREDLARRAAAMELAGVQREAEVAGARDRVAQARRKGQVAAELELAAMAEAQQLAKLRAMAQLDREIAEQEQAHVMARRAGLAGLTPEQMIAMQAAELAKGDGGGAAWAAALAANAGGERRHADEQRAVYEKAMAAMAEVATSRAAPAPAPLVQVSPAAATAAAVTTTCAACGAALRADAAFCGACGTKPVR